jgi:hypothetical protein
VLEELLDGAPHLLHVGIGARLPAREGQTRVEDGDQGLVLCIFVHELLRKVVWDAVDAILQTLIAGRLARLYEAFDLELLALGTWGCQGCSTGGRAGLDTYMLG